MPHPHTNPPRGGDFYPDTGGDDRFNTPCVEPSLKPTIVSWAFPNAPGDGFWSSSPYALEPDTTALAVFFNNGQGMTYANNNALYVRLVRGGQ